MSGLRALALFVAGQLFMGAVAGTLWIALTPRPAEPRPLQVFLHSLATGQEEKTGAEKNPQPALPITVESPSKPRTALAIRPLMDALLGGIHSQQSSPRVADPDPPAPEYPLDGALARTMRERLDTLGAAKDGGLAEAADTLPEVQPLLDQLNALRGKWSLQDVAANPEMLEPLGMMLDEVAGVLSSLQGGMGGGMGMSGGAGQSLDTLLAALGMIEDIMADLGDGLIERPDSGTATRWNASRMRGLLFWLLMRNNGNGLLGSNG